MSARHLPTTIHISYCEGSSTSNQWKIRVSGEADVVFGNYFFTFAEHVEASNYVLFGTDEILLDNYQFVQNEKCENILVQHETRTDRTLNQQINQASKHIYQHFSQTLFDVLHPVAILGAYCEGRNTGNQWKINILEKTPCQPISPMTTSFKSSMTPFIGLHV